MKEYKNVLLLKLPFCSYPQADAGQSDFRQKAPFRPIPSLALAALSAFFDKYKKNDYRLEVADLNIRTYTRPGVSIDTFSYKQLLLESIKNSNYDVLALSVMFVFNVKWVESAVRHSRRFKPEAPIIIGGGYPTIFPAESLKRHDVDYAVMGEGEATFIHILNKLNNYHDPDFSAAFAFDGYAEKNKNGEVAVVPKKSPFLDVENLPQPAWHYLDVEKYFEKSGDRLLPIEASRGCPYSCTYCSTYMSWGRRVRYKPVEKLMREIIYTKNTFNPDVLSFIDDNLAFDRDWFVGFLKEFIKAKIDIKIDASNFAVRHLDAETIDLLKAAGIRRIALAVESGSEQIQRKINKNVDFDRVRELVKLIKSKGLFTHICWMIGFPGETLEQINQTFNFAAGLKAESNQFLRVLPYPGTVLFREAAAGDLLVFDDSDLEKFENRTCDYIKSDEWNYKLLTRMIYDTNIKINFLDNAFLDSQKDQDKMLQFVEELLARLSDHVIAHIIAGYIYRQKGRDEEGCQYYDRAVSLLKTPDLSEVFSRYLSWKHRIIDDFNDYREGKVEPCREKAA